MNKNKNIYSIITLCLLLVGMNYINAWTGPATSPLPTNPPNNNVAAPINVGSIDQVKAGDLGVAGFIADSVFATGVVSTIDQMNSPLYCDENGANCTTSASLGGGTGIGYNQTWQVVSRAQGVWYQNATAQPIMVFHKNIWDGTVVDVGVSTTVFVTMNYQDYDSDLDNGSTIIIPVGNYYRFGTATGNSGDGHRVVRELRAP